MRRLLKAVLVIGLFEAVLRAFSFLSFSYALVTPIPSLLAQSLWHNRLLIAKHSFVTFSEIFFGFCFAVVLSIFLAIGMLKSKKMKKVIQSTFFTFQAMPLFVLSPLLLMFFGLGVVVIMIPIVLSLSFPMTINLFQGLDKFNREKKKWLKMHGLSAWLIFKEVELPEAMYQIFSSLKIACAIAGTSAIAGEWIGGQMGLGVLLQRFKRDFDMQALYSLVFLIFILSYTVMKGIERMERQWKMRCA